MRKVRSIIAGLFAMLVGTAAWAGNCAGFTDVDTANTTYCSAVIYIANKGITLGCTATMYCPNDYVTRLQMALFFQRAGKGDATNVTGYYFDTVGGGKHNTASEPTQGFNVVSGGSDNSATGGYSVIGGGLNNTAQGLQAVVAGGRSNAASGAHSMIMGGTGNTASGDYSFAGGLNADANLDGCFVWGDTSTNSPVTCGSVTPNQFVVRSVGGVYFLTAGTDDAHYSGASLLPGATSWTTYSDRNGKDNIEVVDPRAVLERLLSIPVATWNWKSQDPSIRHMGPMAQDFAAAFNLGETQRGINTVDADGVALAAIQGLNAKLEAQARELADLRARLAAIADRQDVASIAH